MYSTSEVVDMIIRVSYAYSIRSIMYAIICTRPDVLCTLSMTSYYHANPSESHCITVKKIMKYLRRTTDMFLVFSGKEAISIKDYKDASSQTNRDDSLS